MSKKIQLSIAEPCHENWDAMAPVEKGRFCGSCQKQVVDFSTMSDRQVAEFFKKPIQSLSGGGSVCGRFMEDQLERDIDIPRKRIPWVKYFFQFTLPAFLFSMKATAQGKVSVAHIKNPVATPTCSTAVGTTVVVEKRQLMGDTTMMIPPASEIAGMIKLNTVNTIAAINGKVVDEKGMPVPFAYIEVINQNLFITADSLGLFSIKLKPGQNIVTVNVSSVGYQPKENILLNTDTLTDSCVIQLLHDAKPLPVVVITSYSTTKGKIAMTGAYSVCRKYSVTSVLKDWISPAKDSVRVYPNPVKAGASVHIAWKKRETGKYILQLLTVSGQMVFTKELWIDDDARVLDIQLPSVAAGTYFLRISNAITKKGFSEKLVVF